MKVKCGEAVYERDGVLFDAIQYNWAVLAMLQRVAMEYNETLCVLDFGGSLGTSYYQNKDFLKQIKKINWCIVEQCHFVECGKKYFQNEELNFYFSVEDCLAEHTPNILLLSSVLSYLDRPVFWIEKLVSFDFPYIIVDRTGFIDSQQDVLTIQNTDLIIYKVSYPAWFFNLNCFKKLFSNKYTLISQFDNGITSPIQLNGKKAFWDSLIFKKI